ncbi:MAG: thermonuclease family protein [Rhodospirillales bacterium]
MLLLIAWVCGLDPAAAQTPGRSHEVIDGATLKIDAKVVRLAGIEVPLPGDGRYAQRWAEQARRAVQSFVADKTLNVTPAGAGRDRYGRRLVHIGDEQGHWLQGELLRAGLARVWVPWVTPERLDEMLKLEQEARLAKRGMWGDAFFVVLSADAIDRRHLDRLQIVEGRVKAVATVRNTTYLNFGDDWRSDFTIEMTSDVRRAFVKAKLDPKTLPGKLIRVRGWPIWRNGPAIEVKFPAQIEMLD